MDEVWEYTGGHGERQMFTRRPPGPAQFGLSFGPKELSNGETEGSSLPKAPGFLPVNPGEPPVPHPPHKVGLRQESVPLEVRDGKGSAADHGSTLEWES